MARRSGPVAVLLCALLSAGSAPAGPDLGSPRPLLWRLAGQGGADVYLLGAFHLLKETDHPVSFDIDAALEDAEAVVFEVAPAELEDPSVGERMVRLATSDPAKATARVMPPGLRQQYERRLREMRLRPDGFDGFEPWFVGISLASAQAQSLGYSPQYGLDRHLMASARAMSKPVHGLESLDSQLQVMDGTPLADQLQSLREFVEDPARWEREFVALHAAWRDGDVGRLQQLARQDLARRSTVWARQINGDRNRAWLPRIEAMLRRGGDHDTLVVVGALHLLDADGLVALLQAKGYRAERICSRCALETRPEPGRTPR